MIGFDIESNGFDVAMIGFDVESNGFDVAMIGFDVESNGFDVAMIGFDVESNGFDAAMIGFDVESNGFDVAMIGFDVAMIGFDVESNGFDAGSNGFDVGSNGFDVAIRGSDIGSNGFDAAILGANPQGSHLRSSKIPSNAGITCAASWTYVSHLRELGVLRSPSNSHLSHCKRVTSPLCDESQGLACFGQQCTSRVELRVHSDGGIPAALAWRFRHRVAMSAPVSAPRASGNRSVALHIPVPVAPSSSSMRMPTAIVAIAAIGSA